MNFYENLKKFDTTNFSEESLHQHCGNEGRLTHDHYAQMGVECPKAGSPSVAILLAEDYGASGKCDNCPWLPMQVACIFAANAGYAIKRISNATQLDGCEMLILPHAELELPSQFFLTSAKKVGFSLEAEVFARCIVEAVHKGIPILAVGNSMLLLAAMGGLKLCRRDSIETPFDHAKGEHSIEVVEDTPFSVLNNLKVVSQHSAFVAPPKVQREELNLGESSPLPFWAFARDGMPEGIGDFEHGILGVQWLPNFFAQKEQWSLLLWLYCQVEQKRQGNHEVNHEEKQNRKKKRKKNRKR